MEKRGFTLVEVLVSLAVLTIGLTGVAALLIQGMSACDCTYQRDTCISQSPISPYLSLF